ncbi:MAG TPA: shikimate kinase [Desulfobulbaceae bacterium]|nr:shikimate kinase [Desulfobulbaceae bacterium]
MSGNIVLTGFMGTGKSTVGKLLAARLGWRFADTDALIEERQGQSITAIFAKQGEAAFRQMEAALARELAGKENLVIATGGKFMLAVENVQALAASRVFCLTAEPEEILVRIMADGAALRPLLAGADPAATIRRLLTERATGYGRFPAISGGGKTPEAIADEILALI